MGQLGNTQAHIIDFSPGNNKGDTGSIQHDREQQGGEAKHPGSDRSESWTVIHLEQP